MNIFGALTDGLIKITKDTIKIRSIDKKDLQDYFHNNITSHNILINAMDNFSDKEINNWFRDQVRPSMKKSPSSAKNVYDELVKSYRGKAANDERARIMGALLEANRDMLKIMQEISTKLDKLVDEEAITIWNIRMSYVAILGIMRQSDMLCRFTTYLYSYMIRLSSQTDRSIPRYREAYLCDHVQKVAYLVTQIRDKKGPYTFLHEVDTLRRKNADLVLGATGSFNFGNFAVMSNYSISFLDNIITALSCLNIFGAAIDAWDDYQFAKYEKNKEMKEWLENHTALLRMDMEDMDKTSPEYQRLVTIVKTYDEKIAEYDRDIQEFEKG